MASLRGRARPLFVARLEQLEHFGFAKRTSPTSWDLAPGWQSSLRDLGIRGDILKQIHVAMSGDPSRYRIVRPGQPLAGDGLEASVPVVGRVAAKGMSDELKGSYYVVVETPEGHGYHLPIDARAADTLRTGDVVTFASRPESPVRAVDRAIAERAAASGGVYVCNSPSGGDEQGLRELERAGLVTREPSDAPAHERRWRVPPDLAARIPAHPELGRARHRLFVQKDPVEIGAQVRHQGPVWLDRVRGESLAYRGFGAEVRRLLEQRREVLRGYGIDPNDPARTEKLGQIERRAIGERLAARTGQRFVDTPPDAFRGRLQVVQGGAGEPYAAVSDGARFVLVPATREDRAFEGKAVTLSKDREGRVVVRRGVGKDRGS